MTASKYPVGKREVIAFLLVAASGFLAASGVIAAEVVVVLLFAVAGAYGFHRRRHRRKSN